MFDKKARILEDAQERAKASVQKKETSILKTYEEPVLPTLCKIIFWGKMILVAAMLLVDINAFVRYDSHLGFMHLFSNVVLTGFFSWLILSAVLILLCGLAAKQASARFWNQKKKNGLEDKTQEDRERSERAVKRLKAPYQRYMKIDLSGLGFWAVLYIIYLLL